MSASTPSSRSRPDRLVDLYATAAEFYRQQLQGTEGAGPAAYLERTGVPLDGPWALGYAPDRPTALVNELRRHGFADLEIRASGLTANGPGGVLVDRFRQRVMVGIRADRASNAPIVAFTGYAPPTAAADVPRQLHSPGTAISWPTRLVFGLAEQHDRSDGPIVVARDPLEAIALSTRTAGTATPPLVVAPAGQHLTHGQVSRLAGYVDLSRGVIAVVSADPAQRSATERVRRLLEPAVGRDPDGRPRLRAATHPQDLVDLLGGPAAAPERPTEDDRAAPPPASPGVKEPEGETGRSTEERGDAAQKPQPPAEEKTKPVAAPERDTTEPEPETDRSTDSGNDPPPAPTSPAQEVDGPARASSKPTQSHQRPRPRASRPAHQLPLDFDAPAPAPSAPRERSDQPAAGPRAPTATPLDPGREPTPGIGGEWADAPDGASTPSPSAPDANRPTPSPPARDETAPAAPRAASSPPAPSAEPPSASTPPTPSAEPPSSEAPASPGPARPDTPTILPGPPTSETARIQANLAAIEALTAQTREGRPATSADREAYARWSGWGATPLLFDERPGFHERYAAERSRLKELIGDAGYSAARTTTLNAHYTDPAYVTAIWKAVAELGFTEGDVLEPGCGSGNFLAQAPEGAAMTGVELDPTTAAIAQALHPHAQVRSESFADTRIANGAFDLVVGNVPFGQHKLADAEHNPGRRQPIHNHFILKSLELTRPGGVVALITSRFTLDGIDEPHVEARARMSELADLVGAVRLPTDAHRDTAGTKVVTDLLVFRRREEDREAAPSGWRETRALDLPDPANASAVARFNVNTYFDEHPEHVLGTVTAVTGRRGPVLAVTGDDRPDRGLGEALRDIVSRAREAELGMAPPTATKTQGRDDDFVSYGNLSEQEGVFLERGNGRFVQIRDGRPVPHAVPKTQIAQLRALIELRDTVLDLLDEEVASREPTERMAALRTKLNDRYDAYVAKHGAINGYKISESTRVDQETGETVPVERRIYPRLGGFRDDPYWPYVMGLERFDDETQEVKKADVLLGRVIDLPSPIDHAQSPSDALVISWDQHNEVRLDEIARLLSLPSPEAAREALGELVYDDPETGSLVRKAEYLSGNVRRKLLAAERAAADDPRYALNVERLRAVVPRDLTPGEIGARMGSPWIKAEYVQQFLCEILEDPSVRVGHLAARWSVEGGSKSSVLARAVWGTQSTPAQELAEKLLNSQVIIVNKPFGDGKSIRDTEATAHAQAKAQQLDERFRAWLWEQPDRAADLVRTYNDRFNSLVPRTYDGEQISAPGLSMAYKLHPHQMAAVARVRETPGVGLFHGTGAGKTLEMIVGGMELRRLGLITKPAYVVPKGVLGQFQREFMQAYPRARILAADNEDLRGDKRREFIGRCSTGNWDAVILSHNAFKTIPVTKAARIEYLEQEQGRLQSHLANASDADRSTVKDIEKQIQTLAERIKEETKAHSDAGIEFERTGISYLFIDEAQAYKNLRVISNIRELSHNGNQITSDLDMKLLSLRRTYGRRVVTLATATPVDNSPSEILTMTKYAAPELLEESGITEDDEFHAAYIQPRRRLEMRPDGSGFESRTRHARYVNLPELKRLLYSWADVKLKKHLDLDEPEIIGGEPEILTVPACAELTDALVDAARRAKLISDRIPEQRLTTRGEMKEDNILWVSTDGRLASLDVRLAGRTTTEPQKVDVIADRMAEIWREHKDDVYIKKDGTREELTGSLQLCFCDQGVPGKGRWSWYEELRDQLVARGLPADQIRFAQDAKNRREKDALQRDAREGKVAVLIGSRAGLGTGVNVQRRVVAIVQADATWKLTPITQSLGRGQRQGNANDKIHHIFAVTEGSYDPFLWQKVDDKARFTDQVLDPDETARVIDAISEDNGGKIDASVMFAVAAGRPELLQLHRLEETVAALRLEQRIWNDEQYTYRATIGQNERTIRELDARIGRLDTAIEQRVSTAGDAFAMYVDVRAYARRVEAGTGVLERLQRALQTHELDRRAVQIGELGGFGLLAVRDDKSLVLEFDGAPAEAVVLNIADLKDQDPVGLIRALENRLTGLDRLREGALEYRERLRANVEQAQRRVGQPFPQADELKTATSELEALQKMLEDVPERGRETVGAGVAGGAGSNAGSRDERAVADGPAPPAGGGPDERPPVAHGAGAGRNHDDDRPSPPPPSPSLPDALAPHAERVARLAADVQGHAHTIEVAVVNHPEKLAQHLEDWVHTHLARQTLAEEGPVDPFVLTYIDDQEGGFRRVVLQHVTHELLGSEAMLQRFHSEVEELTRRAHDDPQLLSYVKQTRNSRDDIRLSAIERLDDLVLDLAQERDEVADFSRMYLREGSPLRTAVNEAVLDDVWARHRQTEHREPVRADFLSDRRHLLGLERMNALASEAQTQRTEIGGLDSDALLALRDEAEAAFSRMHRAGAMQTLRVERDLAISHERIATAEAELKRLGQVPPNETRAAAQEREQQTSVQGMIIDRERDRIREYEGTLNELRQSGEHLDGWLSRERPTLVRWLAAEAEAAAPEVAPQRERAAQAEVEVDVDGIEAGG